LNVRQKDDGLDSDSPCALPWCLRPRSGCFAPEGGTAFPGGGLRHGDLLFPVFEAMAGQGVFLAAEWDEDRLRRFLTRLESYAEHPGYTRIEVVRAKPDRLPLPDHCADLVLMAQATTLWANAWPTCGSSGACFHPAGPSACSIGARTPRTRGGHGSPAPGAAACGQDPGTAGGRGIGRGGLPVAGGPRRLHRHWCLTGRV